MGRIRYHRQSKVESVNIAYLDIIPLSQKILQISLQKIIEYISPYAPETKSYKNAEVSNNNKNVNNKLTQIEIT